MFVRHTAYAYLYVWAGFFFCLFVGLYFLASFRMHLSVTFVGKFYSNVHSFSSSFYLNVLVGNIELIARKTMHAHEHFVSFGFASIHLHFCLLIQFVFCARTSLLNAHVLKNITILVIWLANICATSAC